MTVYQYFKSNKKYFKVKLTKISTQHLVVNAKVNFMDGLFILDTGASSTVIDEKAKKKFFIHSTGFNNEGVGAGASNLQIELSKDNVFSIGRLKLKNFDLAIMDLSHVNKALVNSKDKEIDGVIGADILIRNKGVIDYGSMYLYLLDKK